MKNTILTSLVLLLGIGNAFGQDTRQYIRFLPGKTQTDGALQIAVETWRTPKGVLIDLYGVVHIADKKYYQQVQQDLNKYDAVLYEGVGATKDALADKRQKKSSGLSSIQRLFGTVLGLQFQMDGIAYTHSNLIHADMTLDNFQRQTQGQQLNPLEQYVTPEQLEKFGPLISLGTALLEKLMEARPDFRNTLKIQFGSQISQADLTKQLPPQLYQTIVIDRNTIVVQILDLQLRHHPNKKHIAIFYGAAHMPDFAQRFSKLGYTKVSTRWMTAWHIGQGPRNIVSSEKKVGYLHAYKSEFAKSR